MSKVKPSPSRVHLVLGDWEDQSKSAIPGGRRGQIPGWLAWNEGRNRSSAPADDAAQTGRLEALTDGAGSATVIHVHHHSEIFRTPTSTTADEHAAFVRASLPTFNSFAIESMLHNIDVGADLATTIVYLNDDFFLLQVRPFILRGLNDRRPDRSSPLCTAAHEGRLQLALARCQPAARRPVGLHDSVLAGPCRRMRPRMVVSPPVKLAPLAPLWPPRSAASPARCKDALTATFGRDARPLANGICFRRPKALPRAVERQVRRPQPKLALFLPPDRARPRGHALDLGRRPTRRNRRTLGC